MRLLSFAVALTLLLALAPAGAAPAAELVTRAWQEPVAIGAEGLFESDAALAPLGEIFSMQQRSGGGARIGVTQTNGFTGATSDTTLWNGAGGYYPRMAVAPTGVAAAAYSDGGDLHIHVRPPGGPWREVGTVFEGQTDYSDGRPLLALTPLGHLVVAWPRKNASGGQRVWLTELAPGAAGLSPPRPLDPVADPGVVQVARDLAVSATGELAVAYLQGPSRTSDLTARVAFGRLGGGALDERHALPGTVTPWSWRAPQVDFDFAGHAAIAWYTVPAGFDQGAAIGDLHLALRRPDGTLGATTELGQTPGDFSLAVSDAGEVLLGYESAGNLSGSGTTTGTWGYSGYGYHAVFGSMLLQRIGPPQLLVPWPGYDAQLAMNRRGDAVVAYTDCCEGANGYVHARRRLPGGSFGDPAPVSQGPLTHASETSYYGPGVGEVLLDEIGNAAVTWGGFGPVALGMNAAVDGPRLELPLPGLELGVDLPPVLPPLPPLPGVLDGLGLPSFPGLPVSVSAGALRRDLARAPLPVAVAPLRLSVTAPARRGVPKQLRIDVRCDQACAVQASARIAGERVGASRGNLRGGRSARVALKLSSAARRAARTSLRRTGRATARVSVTAATSTGGRAQRTARITLRR